ncbi:MAG: ATP-dependent zinc metalloprotease FtsH [Eubacteriales bacterium]|nr:ATP-dependent zinc metalloprotease FtsH [Eubacteriales bacterium]
MNLSNTKKEYTYSDIVGFFENQQVREFTVNVGSGKLNLKVVDEALDKDGNPVSTKDEAAAGAVTTNPTGTTAPVTEPTTEAQSNKTNSAFGGLFAPKEKEEDDGLTKITFKLASIDLFYADVNDYILEYNATHDTNMKYDYTPATNNAFLLDLAPILLVSVVGIVFWFILLKKMQSGGMGGKEFQFGKAKFKDTNDEKRKTTFDDVAGADEEKEELEEIVEFLKNPEKYNELGARIPKGVLLVGPPGTGKTLLARAVAGEAGVPFFSISGSDFVEMFVGVGASRVRDLFEHAKKNSPCIIFIDEIDAVGRQRGTGLGGGHDEREQTLNQMLVEMDGFGANEGVIVISATNRPDILDPALLRPGRFDRQVMVGYPDVTGREAILKVHARKKPLAPDVNLQTIAKTTAGFTGADLANLLNEAALLAARAGKKAITMAEIEEATIKVVVGTEKKSKVMSEREKKLTSYHEAGHAIAHHVMETQDPVHQISIIPRGMAGGFTMALPTEEKSYSSRREMVENIVVLLSGRVAEALVLDDISTGASNDIERATSTARAMVTKYGMSDTLGPINYGGSSNEVFIGRDMGHVKDYSEETSAKIDEEVHSIITKAYGVSEKVLNANMSKLHEVAAYLMKHEKMSGEDFAAMMEGTFAELPEPPEADAPESEETDSADNAEN